MFDQTYITDVWGCGSQVKAAKGPQRPDSPPDPNLAILSIADWGSTPNAKSKQPAQLPSKQANAASKSAMHTKQVLLTQLHTEASAK